MEATKGVSWRVAALVGAPLSQCISIGFDLSTVLFTVVDNSLWSPEMSTSQRLLFAHLLLLLGGPSTGCNGENEYSTDTYCIDMEAAEECPTVEEMNDTVFPTGWQ
jgi:hypothetical protein